MKYLIPFLLLLCVGCTSVTPPKTLNVFSERPKTPGRMTAFWNSYTQTNPHGDVPLRGVGGRILFYNAKNTVEPVKINGDVSIYLFDAHDPVPMRSVPVKHAIFKKENLAPFYRKDGQDLHGYEFFVPVDELGNEERELQVVAVFHEYKKPGKTTALIHSDSAVVTLPGPKRQQESLAVDEPEGESDHSDSGSVITLAGGRAEPNEIVQASYRQPSTAEYFHSRSRQTETIRLPERFARAMQYDRRNDQRDTTQERPSAESPYTPQSPPPSWQAEQTKPQEESQQESDLSPGDWFPAPNRLVNVSQNGPATSSNKFRINSSTTKPTPNLPVHEEVSPSGRKTQVWVQ